MDYRAGIIAFLLFYIPMYFVYRNFKKSNEQIEKECALKLKAIEEKFK